VDSQDPGPCIFITAVSGYLHIQDAEYVLAEDLIKLERGQVCDNCTRQQHDAEVQVIVLSEELHPWPCPSLCRLRSSQ
jgi:hypothetical protein